MIWKIEHEDRELSDPTPQEIRERAAEIRKRWSPRVAERRKVAPEPRWSPPLVLTIELVRELNAKNE